MQGGGCYLSRDSSSTLNRVVSRALLALFFLYLVAEFLRALVGLLEQGNLQTKKSEIDACSSTASQVHIQLEVEPGMEERSERVKSSIQRVKSALSIHSRTPQGNF